MRFYGPYFLLAILVILSLKKTHLDFLTVFLNFFQSLRLQDCWYLLRSLQQLLSHHTLEYLVMLTFLECLSQMFSMLVANIWTMFSRASIL